MITKEKTKLEELLNQKTFTFKSPKNWHPTKGKSIFHKPFKKFFRTDLKDIFKKQNINDPLLKEREIVAQVFPFKINQHIIDLINWNKYETDPIFQLTFPQPEMLKKEEINKIKEMIENKVDKDSIANEISRIRDTKNPAPANQRSNRPILQLEDETYECEGLQHKYEKTCLMFHRNAQTCHAYCTYCFRFNQFVGKDKFLENDSTRLHAYLRQHTEISDILITGGDPATMKADVFNEVIKPLCSPEFKHIKNIRLGTKALTYHPYRFLTEPDADELMDVFEMAINNGKHISIMAHFSHYQEISEASIEAAKRLRSIGCNIRTQAPLMKHINNDPEVWAKLWQKQLNLGMIPYYMFIARDTGPQRYFEVTLSEALNIFQEARKLCSGLHHTVRGPSMSCGPGKIAVMGQEKVAGEDVFILKFLQGRNNDWCDRVFFAKYNPHATWIDQLEPAFGEKAFFFEEEYKSIINK